MNYLPAQLDVLYQAIGAQAEEDFLQALHREFPTMPEHEKTQILNRWHNLRKKAEQKMAGQGERHHDLHLL